MKKTAIAHANIALIKYWGKRHIPLNLPAVGSISMTLEALQTKTSVNFRDDLAQDSLLLNGKNASEKQIKRTIHFLDLIRKEARITTFAEIISDNNFPTGAGLASSASGFAALTVAACASANLALSQTKLSEFSRIGSGSAARSIFGGFVEMAHGKKSDGSDAVAHQLYDENYLPLELLILITDEAEKPIGSTEGMNLTADTSPYYKAWVDTAENDLAEMRTILAEKDFQKLGELAEFSCFKMHGLAMSANPMILYWNSTTVALIHEVRALRKKGFPAYITIDAGPQIKVICPAGEGAKIRTQLTNFPGVKDIILTGLGGDARII